MVSYSLGLGFAVSWLWLFYLQGPLLHPVCIVWGIVDDLLFRWFIGAMSVTCLILAQLLKIQSLRRNLPALVTCTAVLSLGPCLTGILPLISEELATPLIAKSLAVLSGAAAAVFYTAWHETISISDLRKSGMMVGIAFSIASGITILSSIVHYYWVLPLLALTPPISLLLMLRQTPDESVLLSEYQKADSIMLFPVKLILFLGLIYITGGIMLSIISLEQSYTHMFYLTYLAYALFCPIAGLILYNNENVDLRFMYRIVLALMFTGFLILCFQQHALTTAAFALLQGGSALLNMYTWLLFPYIARFSTRPAAVCALGHFITSFSVFSGYMIVGSLSTMAFGEYNVKNLAFIAGVVGALTVFLFPEKKETFSGWLLTYGPEQDAAPNELMPLNDLPLVDALAVTSREQEAPLVVEQELPMPTYDPYNALLSLDSLPLSSREKQVLVFLLRGRNGSFISESLNISSNTVKFHMRNIYSKLSIHNRQELLTLFESKLQ